MCTKINRDIIFILCDITAIKVPLAVCSINVAGVLSQYDILSLQNKYYIIVTISHSMYSKE